MAVSVQTIVNDAMVEIGALDPTQTADATESFVAAGKLNRLLNNWNADGAGCYAVSFPAFTLTPNLQPHTIGPTGTWTLTERPVAIDGLQLVLTNVSPNVNVTIILHDSDWWQNVSVPTLAQSYPTDGYYDPTFPNGSLYLYPIPTTAWGVQLKIRSTLTDALSVTDTIVLPPGYQDAVTLTLAEDLAGLLHAPMPQLLPEKAAKARARIFANNLEVPKITTWDAGMPSGRGRRSNFNYLTGEVVR